MHIICKFEIRTIQKILVAVSLFVLMSVPVYAAEESNIPTFFFEMSIEGSNIKEVAYGDIITVDLKLDRTDADNPYTMYAMQDEIRYDSEFLELVEDGFILDNLTSTDIANTDNFREFYVNFLSMNGGEQWDASTKLGTIHFKVIGKSGVSRITSQDYLVSLKDGSGSYSCEANDVMVIVSTDCTVKFESRGGTAIPDKIVQYGEKLDPPDNPIRNGYVFEGWYSDIDLTDKWDFENDKVLGNMTLYADWSDDVAETTAHYSNWWWLIILLLIIILYWLNHSRKNQSEKKRV